MKISKHFAYILIVIAFIFSVSLLISGIGNHPGQVATVISTLGNGLIAQYKFDEGSGTTVADSSGNANTGTLNGATSWTTAGKIGNALNFNTASSSVSLSKVLPSFTEFTASAWVKVNDLSSARGIFTSGGFNDSGFWFRVNKDGSIFLVMSGGGSYNTLSTGIGIINAGTFYHIAVSGKSGQYMRIYVNGALAKEKITTQIINTPAVPGYIGSDWNTNFELMNGVIDEVRVYNRALTASEITELYNYTGVGGGASSSSSNSSSISSVLSSSSSSSQTNSASPVIKIISPVKDLNYYTNHSYVTVYGTASDDKTLSSITCALSTASSCSITGTTNWIASNLPLKPGSNILTITAKDSSNNSATAQLNINYTPPTADQSWKNYYTVWADKNVDNALKYARQMGYDYIDGLGWKEGNYKNNPNGKGMKFYILGPQYHDPIYNAIPGYNSLSIVTTVETDITKRVYTQDQKNWYSQYSVWKSNDAFPNNLATGWWDTPTRFGSMWDFQQQAVIDYVVGKIMAYTDEYEKNSGLAFAGFQIDVPDLSGDFFYWDNEMHRINLTKWTEKIYGAGLGKDSGLLHTGITHEYSTYADGLAAFYKQLMSRTRQIYPNAKWVIEPARLYDGSFGFDEWIARVKNRADKNELTPDLIMEEGGTTEFVDNSNNFNSGMNITNDMVGDHQRSKVGEYDNRLIAAKAGINGAWYNWWGIFGGMGNMPAFGSITQVYPRLKFIRVIPNWDNLLKVPLSQRSWDGTIYKSSNSYISSDVMYSHHWKTPNKLFAVFNTTSGKIKLKPNETVVSIKDINGFFEEANDVKSLFKITPKTDGAEITFANPSTITIAKDSSNNQVKGNGYIFTLSALASDTVSPTGSITVNSNAASTNSTAVTLNLSATDNIGVTDYYVSESSNAPTSNQSGWTSITSVTSYSANVPFTFSSGNGTKTLYAWYKDAAGNVSTAKSDSINLNIADIIPPTVTITAPTSNPTYSTTTSPFKISGASSDNVGAVSVIWSNSANHTSGTAVGAAIWSVSNISLVSGTNLITITAKDSAGNIGTDTLTVAYSAPTAIPTVTTNTATNVANDSALLKATVNPNNLPTSAYFEYGLSAKSYTTKTSNQALTGTSNLAISADTGAVLKPNTAYHFRAVAQNSLGAVKGNDQSFTTLKNRDTSKPIGAIAVKDNLDSTDTNNIDLDLSATDNVGVVGYYISESPASPNERTNWTSVPPSTVYTKTVPFILSPEEGTKTIYAFYKDAIGNISDKVSASIIFRIPTESSSSRSDEGGGNDGGGGSGGNIQFSSSSSDSSEDSIFSLSDNSDSSSSESQDAGLPPANPQPSQSPYRFKRLLSYGTKGSDVAELQKHLISEGVYKGPVTGYYGTLTRGAVKKYQAKNKLPPVGAVGPKTLSILNSSASASSSANPSSSSQGFSLRQLVEILISLNVISPDKAEIARTALRTMEGR